MKVPYFEVAAFTSKPFGGNPAGVCLLEKSIPEPLMQSIAAENNLAETAFVVPRSDGEFDIRWFSPVMEIDLCGHATLGSGHVLFNHRGLAGESVRFVSLQSGVLGITRQNGRLALDFPARPVQPVAVTRELTEALGAEPAELFEARDYLAVFRSAAEVRAVQPNFSKITQLPPMGVLLTAPGDDCDFVSRFFVPKHGIDEDHVTGSTHCNLIPFWAERLGKTKMFARQLSKRGGEIYCELRNDRVSIGGDAVTYLTGEIDVPASA